MSLNPAPAELALLLVVTPWHDFGLSEYPLVRHDFEAVRAKDYSP